MGDYEDVVNGSHPST